MACFLFQFGFLKDLGFEKPSWLPDFGDSKAEAEVAPAAAEVTEEEGEGDEGEEAAIEEQELCGFLRKYNAVGLVTAQNLHIDYTCCVIQAQNQKCAMMMPPIEF